MSSAVEDADMPEEIDFSQSMPNPYAGRIRKREVAGDNQTLGRSGRVDAECPGGNAAGSSLREGCRIS